MSKLLETILKTVGDLEAKNKKNKNVETADPAVFDLLRKKVQDIQTQQQSGTLNQGKRKPKNILDMILAGVKNAQKENKKDPNVPTAPKSVFEDLLSKVESKKEKKAATGLKKIIEDYQLNVSNLPNEALVQIQSQYKQELEELNQKYAQGLFDLNKKAGR